MVVADVYERQTATPNRNPRPIGICFDFRRVYCLTFGRKYSTMAGSVYAATREGASPGRRMRRRFLSSAQTARNAPVVRVSRAIGASLSTVVV